MNFVGILKCSYIQVVFASKYLAAVDARVEIDDKMIFSLDDADVKNVDYQKVVV